MSSLFIPPTVAMLPEPVRGIADRKIAPSQRGRVKYQGTYWFAKLHTAYAGMVIPVGQPVDILAVQGLTLLVAPAGFISGARQVNQHDQ